ncbi:uncharacterized protein PV09_09671 [Verruconis gallopava]|uniref:Uncharacterized protein n=1 Tax=Verruconis gallopava TaxID=253628 RepID=A0A0D1ZWZ6_9PEZI|nr:uncharacterized protein PV09_09671 [Verruconis gallopava]KIV98519.1 hypothetical protein PV09_09671 [Verruconis gallopava]
MDLSHLIQVRSPTKPGSERRQPSSRTRSFLATMLAQAVCPTPLCHTALDTWSLAYRPGALHQVLAQASSEERSVLEQGKESSMAKTCTAHASRMQIRRTTSSTMQDGLSVPCHIEACIGRDFSHIEDCPLHG